MSMNSGTKLAGFTLAAVLAGAFLAPAAQATPTIFNVSGVAVNVSGGSVGSCTTSFTTCAFSGTFGIDTTTGTLTAADVNFPGLAAFNNVIQSFSDQPYQPWWVIGVLNADGYSLVLQFTTLPTTASLVGFKTGSIVDSGVNLPGDVHVYNVPSGTITPAKLTAVPEPGVLGMFGFGLVALGAGVAAKRRMGTRLTQ